MTTTPDGFVLSRRRATLISTSPTSSSSVSRTHTSSESSSSKFSRPNLQPGVVLNHSLFSKFPNEIILHPYPHFSYFQISSNFLFYLPHFQLFNKHFSGSTSRMATAGPQAPVAPGVPVPSDPSTSAPTANGIGSPRPLPSTSAATKFSLLTKVPIITKHLSLLKLEFSSFYDVRTKCTQPNLNKLKPSSCRSICQTETLLRTRLR